MNLPIKEYIKKNYIEKKELKKILDKYGKTNIEDRYRIIQFYKELQKLLEDK